MADIHGIGQLLLPYLNHGQLETTAAWKRTWNQSKLPIWSISRGRVGDGRGWVGVHPRMSQRWVGVGNWFFNLWRVAGFEDGSVRTLDFCQTMIQGLFWMKEANDELADSKVGSAASYWRAVKWVNNKKRSVSTNDGSVGIEILAYSNPEWWLLFR